MSHKRQCHSKQHPDRNAQFAYINTRVTAQMRGAQPVISVDTKKKELVGNYKNRGCKWHRKGDAPKVKGHDFPNPDVPRAHPYGVYDLARNRGFVNVGTDYDTGTLIPSYEPPSSERCIGWSRASWPLDTRRWLRLRAIGRLVR